MLTTYFGYGESNRDVGQSTNMAEAAVESPAARFFCHRCTLEISPVLPVRRTYILIYTFK